MMRTCVAALAGAVALLMSLPAVVPAAPATRSGVTADHGARLTVAVGHAPSHFTPGMVAGYFTISVSNTGTAPTTGAVTVTDQIPAGLTVEIAAGPGWSCSGGGTWTCSRQDRLGPHTAYPSIRVIVDVAADVPTDIANTATASDDRSSISATDLVPARDGCPNGWSPEQTVSFSPPFRPGRPGGIDSGVRNPQRADGCTLLDVIWNAEPFRSHARFVSVVDAAVNDFGGQHLLSRPQADAITKAARQSDVGKPDDHQIPNSCTRRIAFTFDDGPSSYRPALLQVLRDKQVHATFFDNGVRVEPNPQWAAFQVREGHVELNHTYTHIHMDEMTSQADQEEVLHNEAVLAAAGAPITFKGIRPPFGGSDRNVQNLLIGMGYTYFLNRINAEDWLPDKSANAIRDDIISQLHPGVIIGMHDGPIDTTAGAATVQAVGMIIDEARQLGYCFGVVDHTGQVVADRYVSSADPVPTIKNPIPYHLPLAFGDPANLPSPWVRIPSPIQISTTHDPAVFSRGATGTLTLTVSNQSGKPTDGSPVAVTDAIPAGLTVTAAAGDGWVCTPGSEITCTRTDVLAPHRQYPPIVITVGIAAAVPPQLANAPTLSGHGEAWTSEALDTIMTGQ
jgi:uncharacterized repeat protein (TIGR01451 family)